jgi:hypothetical protein
MNRECSLPFCAAVASWSEPGAWAIHTALPQQHMLMRSTEVHYPFAFTRSGLHRFGFVGSAATVRKSSRSGQYSVELQVWRISRGYGPLCYFNCFQNQCQEKELSVGSVMPTVELLIGWKATKQSEIFNTRKCRGSTFERKWKDSNDFKEHTKSKQHDEACEAKAAAAFT